MPTEKPRFTITMDQELFDRVNEYQHRNRMSTQTKAVLTLISKGIAQTSSESGTSAPAGRIISQAALDIAEKYDRLDLHGRSVIDAILELELRRPTYTVTDTDSNYDDVRQEAAAAQSSRLSNADQAKA